MDETGADVALQRVNEEERLVGSGGVVEEDLGVEFVHVDVVVVVVVAVGIVASLWIEIVVLRTKKTTRRLRTK